jgi:hypothetical protein
MIFIFNIESIKMSKRLTKPQLLEKARSMGVNTEECKTKDDIIRAIEAKYEEENREKIEKLIQERKKKEDTVVKAFPISGKAVLSAKEWDKIFFQFVNDLRPSDTRIQETFIKTMETLKDVVLNGEKKVDTRGLSTVMYKFMNDFVNNLNLEGKEYN